MKLLGNRSAHSVMAREENWCKLYEVQYNNSYQNHKCTYPFWDSGLSSGNLSYGDTQTHAEWSHYRDYNCSIFYNSQRLGTMRCPAVGDCLNKPCCTHTAGSTSLTHCSAYTAEQDAAVTQNSPTLRVLMMRNDREMTVKGKVQGCHSGSFFWFKKCACVCINSLRKEIPCNLVMVVTRHLLGTGRREAGALGWEGNLIITLHSFVCILKKKWSKII